MQRHAAKSTRHFRIERTSLEEFAAGYVSEVIGCSLIIHVDCFEWLGSVKENSLHAIVTDPPYGVHEYNFDQLEKRKNGNGGVWRIPQIGRASCRERV